MCWRLLMMDQSGVSLADLQTKLSIDDVDKYLMAIDAVNEHLQEIQPK